MPSLWYCHGSLSSLRQVPSCCNRAPCADRGPPKPKGLLHVPPLPAYLFQFWPRPQPSWPRASVVLRSGCLVESSTELLTIAPVFLRHDLTGMPKKLPGDCHGHQSWTLSKCLDLPSVSSLPEASLLTWALPPLPALVLCSPAGPLGWLPHASAYVRSVFQKVLLDSPGHDSHDLALPFISTLTAGAFHRGPLPVITLRGCGISTTATFRPLPSSSQGCLPGLECLLLASKVSHWGSLPQPACHASVSP